ncbi:transformer-2 sex-determining protein-related [Anaeramoeba flamelloides]|uniref:Transformer-2 sex-determining protein-related n=1 Tax=Anaeramoeba flamelloides TaxID=1746091 RepID=A0AAV7ZX35_9EUKA|nr:transformer-2 sex-determining protein-related [Anaeramoeba flamelloides]
MSRSPIYKRRERVDYENENDNNLDREKNRERHKERERSRESEKEKSRERSRERRKERDRSREREKSRERSKERERSREREKDYQYSRGYENEKRESNRSNLESKRSRNDSLSPRKKYDYREKERHNFSPERNKRTLRDNDESVNSGTCLYVTKLSYRVNEEDIKHFFEEVGKVVDVHLVRDHISHLSKGFGFVTMSTSQEAQEAIEVLNNKELDRHPIIVELSKRQRGRRNTPGIYHGKKRFYDSQRGGRRMEFSRRRTYDQPRYHRPPSPRYRRSYQRNESQVYSTREQRSNYGSNYRRTPSRSPPRRNHLRDNYDY